MPKVKVNPTAAQARLLRGLFEFEDLAANPTARQAWRSLSGSYRTESSARDQFGSPNPSTIRAAHREGWLQEFGENKLYPYYVLSDEGRAIAAKLTADDLLSKGYGSQTTQGILRTLAKRHSVPQWAFVPEVRLGPGGWLKYYVDGHPKPIRAEQRIDAVAIHCYPSKKFIRVGYEIKVSRGDFLKELKKPDKRVATELFTNVWYFAAPTGMIKPEELPDGWGLVEINGNFHRRKVQAPWHDAEPLPLPFIASMFRAINTRSQTR